MADNPALPDTAAKKQRRRPVNGNSLHDRLWRRSANSEHQRVRLVERERCVTRELDN